MSYSILIEESLGVFFAFVVLEAAQAFDSFFALEEDR